MHFGWKTMVSGREAIVYELEAIDFPGRRSKSAWQTMISGSPSKLSGRLTMGTAAQRSTAADRRPIPRR